MLMLPVLGAFMMLVVVVRCFKFPGSLSCSKAIRLRPTPFNSKTQSGSRRIPRREKPQWGVGSATVAARRDIPLPSSPLSPLSLAWVTKTPACCSGFNF